MLRASVLRMILLCATSEDHVQGVYVFYLELITDMLHLFVYLVFFIIVFTNYGLPLHLVSPASPLSVPLYPTYSRGSVVDWEGGGDVAGLALLCRLGTTLDADS